MRVTVYKLLVRAVVPLLMLAALALPSRTASAAQPGQPQVQAAADQVEGATRREAGGEANLKLPDLSSVQFHGISGRALLGSGLIICVLGLLFGLMTFTGLKNLRFISRCSRFRS